MATSSSIRQLKPNEIPINCIRFLLLYRAPSSAKSLIRWPWIDARTTCFVFMLCWMFTCVSLTPTIIDLPFRRPSTLSQYSTVTITRSARQSYSSQPIHDHSSTTKHLISFTSSPKTLLSLQQNSLVQHDSPFLDKAQVCEVCWCNKEDELDCRYRDDPSSAIERIPIMELRKDRLLINEM